jgi:MinD-like ATPase involved in chromosome partitioning or flagellar assembly
VTVQVVTAADGAGWESGVVAALENPRHGLRVARRCVDVVELLAVCAAGHARVALLAGELRGLDADVVERLRLAGVVPVGVHRSGAPAAADRLRDLGLQYVVADADGQAIIAAVAAAIRGEVVPAVSALSRAFADPSAALIVAPGAGGPVESHELPRTPGRVIAVWGPTGAPGRTTVAINLAAELARLGRSALLADLDVYGGTVAATLGLLDDSPGIAAACRNLSAGGDATSLAALCWQLGPRLRVLTGIPLASRWPELRPSALDSVLGVARGLAEYTVLDCGFGLEVDEELSYDTVAPRRNGATLAALDGADVVLAVGSADPIGVQRLVRGLSELREAEVATPTKVVLNRVRPGVVPGDARIELAAALERFAGRRVEALLPLDQEAADAALCGGRMLCEVRPASNLRTALVALAADIAGVAAPVPRRRRLRRSAL